MNTIAAINLPPISQLFIQALKPVKVDFTCFADLMP